MDNFRQIAQNRLYGFWPAGIKEPIEWERVSLTGLDGFGNLFREDLMIPKKDLVDSILCGGYKIANDQ